MAVKITKNFDFRTLERDLTQMRIPKPDRQEIADIIVAKIISGSSPVSKKGQFKNYSKAYAKKKGRMAPVDMVQSGDMLNSLIVKSKRGGVQIQFRSEIAGYHDSGAGKLPVRRLLPKENERFTKKIENLIFRVFNKSVKRVVDKFNK